MLESENLKIFRIMKYQKENILDLQPQGPHTVRVGRVLGGSLVLHMRSDRTSTCLDGVGQGGKSELPVS